MAFKISMLRASIIFLDEVKFLERQKNLGAEFEGKIQRIMQPGALLLQCQRGSKAAVSEARGILVFRRVLRSEHRREKPTRCGAKSRPDINNARMVQTKKMEKG